MRQPPTKQLSINMKVNKIAIPKIPYLNLPDAPIITKSQDFVPIADINDDIVLFRDGGACVVLESTSLNFGLLSEKEQQAVIVAYAALLNSLSFPIEITIRSQIKDISSYIKYLDEQAKAITNPKLAGVMQDYKNFVNETIKKKRVLGKNFYIIIPFSPLELGVAKSAAAATRKRMGPLPFPKSYVARKAKIALYPKRDHLIRQSKRLGLFLKQLSTTQLIDLYYKVLNPEPPAARGDKDEIEKSQQLTP